jgi:hypothetical protein
MHQPRSQSQVGKGLFWGALLGLVASFVLPRNYVAEVSLLFPSINSSVVKQVSKTLKLDGANVDWNKTVATSDAQMVAAANLVLKSRAAVVSSLRDAKVILPRTVLVLQGDPVENFRNHNIELDTSDFSVRLKVSYSRAEDARGLCQGLLNYYTTFVHEHRLTNTARTRQQLEEKLVRVDRRLSVLEKKLVATPDSRSRVLADLTGHGDSKVLKEIWKQRILDGGSSGRVLDEMRKVRKEADRGDAASDTQIGLDWRSRWGSTTLQEEGEESNLPRTARRADLPSRLELERVYEETLLLYHAGLVQYDFLSMWESLENFDFEVVDPVTVHQEGSMERTLLCLLVGGLLGACLGLVLRRGN